MTKIHHCRFFIKRSSTLSMFSYNYVLQFSIEIPVKLSLYNLFTYSRTVFHRKMSIDSSHGSLQILEIYVFPIEHKNDKKVIIR